MSFLQKVKQVLGIGGVKVVLEVPEYFSREGNTVSGRIKLTSKSDQHITELEVKLEEVWKIGKGDDEEIKEFELGEWKSNEAFDIKAGETKEFDFILNYQLIKSKNDEMQETAGKVGKALGGLGKMMDGEKSTYWLNASADVKGTAFDPNDTVELKLQ